MNKLNLFSFLAMLIAVISGCNSPADARSAHIGGGVGVGNGFRAYQSPSGIGVTYLESLRLVVASETSFVIDNAPLIASPHPISSIQFEVGVGTVNSPEELRGFVADRHPNIKFTDISISGAYGLFHEERDDRKLSGTYYLLAHGNHLITVTVVAYAVGDGLTLVAPIVRTLTVDSELPKIVEIRAPAHVQAGMSFELQVRVTDEGSGFKPEFIQTFNQRFYWEKNKDIALEITSAPAALENGWFSYRVNVPAQRPAGRYRLPEHACIYTFDNAGNNGCIPVPYRVDIQVHNSSANPVVELPKITEAKLSKKTVEVGDSFQVLIHVSGIFSPNQIRNFNMRFAKFAWEASHIKSGYQAELPIEQSPKFLGNGWFSYNVPVSKYRPSGLYQLNIHACVYLSDSAENSGCVALPEPYDLSVRVTNDSGQADIDIPRIAEARVSQTRIRSGENFQVLVRIVDTGTGYSPDQIRNFNSGFLWQQNRDIRLDISSSPQYLGDGWFSYDVPVSPYRPAGKYISNAYACIYLQDKADNQGCSSMPELSVEVVD